MRLRVPGAARRRGRLRSTDSHSGVTHYATRPLGLFQRGWERDAKVWFRVATDTEGISLQPRDKSSDP